MGKRKAKCHRRCLIKPVHLSTLHSPWACSMDLQPGMMPLWNCSQSVSESQAMDKYIMYVLAHPLWGKRMVIYNLSISNYPATSRDYSRIEKMPYVVFLGTANTEAFLCITAVRLLQMLKTEKATICLFSKQGCTSERK